MDEIEINTKLIQIVKENNSNPKFTRFAWWMITYGKDRISRTFC